jgi:FkbM family methyltransferase
MFAFRPGTCDQNVFRNINEFDEYRLPQCFAAEDVIVDIGAHIGSFTHACLQRGAKHVVAFEPDPENFRLAQANLAEYGGRVELNPEAVWRSDKEQCSLRHSGYCYEGAELNTGGGDVIFEPTAETDSGCARGTVVRGVRFDDVILMLGNVRLVKLDCEGSEWPILLTCQVLHRIEALCGEYHEIGGPRDPRPIPVAAEVDGYTQFTVQELRSFLQQHFHRVHTEVHGRDNLGLFWAAEPKVP